MPLVDLDVKVTNIWWKSILRLRRWSKLAGDVPTISARPLGFGFAWPVATDTRLHFHCTLGAATSPSSPSDPACDDAPETGFLNKTPQSWNDRVQEPHYVNAGRKLRGTRGRNCAF